MKSIMRVENLTHTYGENTPFCRRVSSSVLLSLPSFQTPLENRGLPESEGTEPGTESV